MRGNQSTRSWGKSNAKKALVVVLLLFSLTLVMWGAEVEPTAVAQRPSPTPTDTPVPPTPTNTPTPTPTSTSIPPLPTNTPGPPPPPQPGPPSIDRGAYCIRGRVLNWGHRYEPLANVSFTRFDGSQLTSLTDVTGLYQLYGIADQVGRLNIETNWPGHSNLTHDVYIRPDCEEVIDVWLGFHSGATYPEMPVVASMSLTPEQPKPGDVVTFRVEILNQRETSITQLMVTDFLPEQLAFVSAGGTGRAAYADGLLTIRLDDLLPDESTWVTIDARVDPEVASGVTFPNWVSVIYRESAAVQAEVEVKVVGTAAPTAVATVAVAEAEPAATAAAEPEMVPVTGEELPLSSVEPSKEELLISEPVVQEPAIEHNSGAPAIEEAKVAPAPAVAPASVDLHTGASSSALPDWTIWAVGWGFLVVLFVFGWGMVFAYHLVIQRSK
jgi:uncharacterized repeat protein (TIGR01451 family)